MPMPTSRFLQPGTTLTFDEATDDVTYTTHEHDSISLVATIYLARSAGPALFNSVTNLTQVVSTILDLQPLPADPNATMAPNTPINPGTHLAFALPNGTEVAYITNPLDTPNLVATYFLSLATDLIDATDFIWDIITLNNLGNINPDQPAVPDTTLKIPTFTYTVSSGDTLNRISQLFGVAIDQLADIPKLLAVHATLSIPSFAYAIADNDTLMSIAQKFNLSLDALSTSIAAQGGIFADQTPDGKAVVLTIPRVPARHTTDLIEDLVQHGAFNQTAAMVSRFLLHGLRLPVNTSTFASLAVTDLFDATISAGLATSPLYALIGQQFTLAGTPSAGYEISLTNSAQVDWLSFSMSSFYATAGTTLDSLAARFAEDQEQQSFKDAIGALNPNITFPLTTATWLQFPAGMALKTFVLNLTQEESQQMQQLASATFTPDMRRMEQLPLFRQSPYRYGLQKKIPWQTAVLPAGTCLSNPNQYVTAPTIWPFPGSLQEKLEALPDASQLYKLYELIAGTQENGAGKLATAAVGCYMWGTQVSFRVQRIPSSTAGGSLPGSYLLIGTDDAGRSTLQNVWTYLNGEAAKNQAVTSLYLLYTPNATGTNTSGLVSDHLNTSRTFILRTNLSTLSQSGAPAALMDRVATFRATPQPPEGQYDAPLSDTSNFIKLLWECSVVSSGGYYLDYTTIDGNGLPDYLFEQANQATLSLLILVADPKDNALHPSIGKLHNCAVLGQNIDTGKSSLFVQPIIHIVVDGDSLQTVVNELNLDYRLGLSTSDIAISNADNKNLLAIGAKLDTGTPDFYTIKYGDTFASVATDHKMSVAQLVGTGQNANALILEAGALVQIRPGQMQQIATVPPGHVGFQLQRLDPDPNDTLGLHMTPGNYLKTLFQLLSYSIMGKEKVEEYRFVATGAGLPAGPTMSDHDATDGLKTRSLQKATGEKLWRYQKALPVYRFVKDGLVSDSTTVDPNAALPPAISNPYRGIYHAASNSANDLYVTLDLHFQDAYGNLTRSDEPVGPLDVPFGYFDNLIGLDSWPSLSCIHTIQPINGNPAVHVDFSFKIGQYIPSKDTSYANALKNAGAHRALYATILYQIWQPDLIFRLRTSLDQPPQSGQSAEDGYPPDTFSPPRTPYAFTRGQKLRIAAIAGSVHAFLTAARNLNAYQYVIQSSDDAGKVADDFGTDVSALFSANSAVDATNLFGSTGKLSIPTFYAVLQGDTINGIASEVTIDSLLNYNLAVPLNVGLDIVTSGRQYLLKDTETLRGIATANKATVAALAETNSAHLLTPSKSLVMSGVSLPIEGNDTLQSMVDKFKDHDIATTAADLGLANQDTPDLFDQARQPNLTITDYVIQRGDTLHTIQTTYGFDPATILTNEPNAHLLNLFAVGTLLQNGVTNYAIQPGDTLNSIAGLHNTTLTQLAILNAHKLLVAGPNGKVFIPFTATLDQNMPPASTYLVRGAMTLAEIAGKYIDPQAQQTLTVVRLAELNQYTPYLFQPDKEITVDTTYTVQTSETDTFASLYNKLVVLGYSGTFAAFVTAIATTNDLLQDQALFACPPISTGQNQTLAQLAQTYGVDAFSLIEANCSLSGLLQEDHAYLRREDRLYRRA